jgi:hypothetical protein
MSLATLVQKLKSRKQVAERTTFQQYLAMVRELASGAECDSDEVAIVLDVADKNEADLERDANLQQQRFARRSTMDMNRQALQDRLQAEGELKKARQALQESIDRLMPAVDMAHDRLKDANHRASISTGAEEWLSDPENILDVELLARESAVASDLRAVTAEMKPLEADRTRKQTFLSNLEARLSELQKAASVPWLPLPMTTPWLGRVNGDIRTIESRISDVRSELQQLDRAIQPRRIEQSRLQAELNQIHQQKLLP